MHLRSIASAALVLISLAAIAQKKPDKPREFTAADLGAYSWRSVGPANMGGRIADIEFAPGSSKEFFVGFGVSGVWKTVNKGTTFTPVFDHEVTNSIGSVAIADAPDNWRGWKDDKKPAIPLTPEQEKNKGKGKIVWVGSGEGNGRNSSSWGHGMYLSTDGGASFKNVGLEEASDIPRIAVDPRDPDVCYAAALGRLWGPNKMRGIYKTIDAGKTWKPSLQIDENTGAIDVIMDPSNPDTLYAAMYMRRRTPYSFMSGGKEGGIYKTTDGGGHWTKLTNGLPKQTGRIGIDIYKKDPKIVYALVESDEGGTTNLDDDRSRNGGLFRSDNGGETWTRLHGRVPRAFYFSKVRVDPTDDQRVYILGYGVDVSDDGGHTFRSGLADHTHGDVHALTIDPNDHEHLLLGDDGGLFESFDKGETWEYINTMAVGQFYNIAVDNSEPYNIFGGLQDNGSWMGPSRGKLIDYSGQSAAITNADWKMLGDGDGFHCAFDPADQNIVYFESQGGALGRLNMVTGESRGLMPIPKEGAPGFRFNWNTPFLVSAHEAKTLYMGGNRVFKLTDRGDNWEAISPDLTKHEIDKDVTTGSNAETYGTVVSLAESPVAQGLLWAGSDDGLIHVTEDDGANWRDVTPKEVDGRYVAKLVASPHDRNTVYAAIDMHRDDNTDPLILTSKDLGKTWQNITGDLPKGWSAKSVWVDLRSPGIVYCGTQNGMYITANDGKNWVKMNGGSLPTVPIEDILQQPRTMDLLVATHGRSIWILDNSAALSQVTPAIMESNLHLFDLADAAPFYQRYTGAVLGNKPFMAVNPPAGASIDYWCKDDGGASSIVILDSKNNKIRTLSGTAKPGVNRVMWDLLAEPNMRLAGHMEDPGQPMFVAPGDYTVVVTVGANSDTKKIKVLPVRV